MTTFKLNLSHCIPKREIMTLGWIFLRESSAKIDKPLGLPKLICLEYACVRKECDDELCIEVHLDYYDELSEKEKNIFEWWAGFNPTVMIIYECKSPLHSESHSLL